MNLEGTKFSVAKPKSIYRQIISINESLATVGFFFNVSNDKI